MNISSLFEGIGNELQAAKNRVRNLIGEAHWLSDGIWKERVLITALRRHLPTMVQIGTGFVASKDGLSTQIDILLYDASRPTLFRDDDFVILTPESVLGIIEVKTKLRNGNFENELRKLRDNIYLIRADEKRACTEGGSKIFSGLFYYDSEHQFSDESAAKLTALCPDTYSIIDMICTGDTFVRFWDWNPECTQRNYNSWHVYDLGVRSSAYFIMNCIYYLAPYSFIDNDKWWWPEQSKEQRRRITQGSSMTIEE